MDQNQHYAPFEITQGTAEAWTMENADYPATGYTATFTVIATSGSLAVNATASGNDYAFALTSAQTAALFPGSHQYSVKVSNGTETYTVEAGYIYVRTDVSAEQPLGVSGISPTRERYNHYIKLVTQENFIKTMQPGSIEEIEQIIRRLEWDLKREEDAEKAKRGINTTRKIYTRFI